MRKKVADVLKCANHKFIIIHTLNKNWQQTNIFTNTRWCESNSSQFNNIFPMKAHITSMASVWLPLMLFFYCGLPSSICTAGHTQKKKEKKRKKLVSFHPQPDVLSATSLCHQSVPEVTHHTAHRTYRPAQRGYEPISHFALPRCD